MSSIFLAARMLYCRQSIHSTIRQTFYAYSNQSFKLTISCSSMFTKVCYHIYLNIFYSYTWSDSWLHDTHPLNQNDNKLLSFFSKFEKYFFFADFRQSRWPYNRRSFNSQLFRCNEINDDFLSFSLPHLIIIK
jgi:hypothetical protein